MISRKFSFYLLKFKLRGENMNLDYYSTSAKTMSHFANCPIKKSRNKEDYCSDICNDAIYHTLEGFQSYLYYPYQVNRVQNFFTKTFGNDCISVSEKKNKNGRLDYYTVVPERKFTKQEREMATEELRKAGWAWL